MEFEIRAYREGDEKSLMEMWLEFVQDEEGSDLNIEPSEDNAERWMNFAKNLINNKKGELKLALVDETIAGYVLYAWDVSPLKTKTRLSMIYDLYVNPKFRKRGIGSQLLSEALKDLKKKNVDFVQLNVMSKNLPAINLYNKFGFVETLKVMRLYFTESLQ